MSFLPGIFRIYQDVGNPPHFKQFDFDYIVIQAEAEVVPSSSLVYVEVEVGVEVHVKVKTVFFGVGSWVGGWRNEE